MGRGRGDKVLPSSYTGQLRGAETAPSDICTRERGVGGGGCTGSMETRAVRPRRRSSTREARAIATKDTLNDLSRAVIV